MKIEKIISSSGAADLMEHVKLYKELFRLAKQIRDELGENGILLDDFILRVLEALNKVPVFDAVDEGFHEAAKELRSLIRDIREGKGKCLTHPFYQTLKDFISKHPCPAESVYIDYYCASIFFEYAAFALERYLADREKNIRAFVVEINTLVESLTELADPDALAQLCDLIYKCFLQTSPSKIFLQCLTDQYVLSCLTQINGSRHVFQYLIDSNVN